LIEACFEGWPVAIVRLLLEAVANVNYQDIDGWIALMSASRQGHLEHVYLILERIQIWQEMMAGLV
jgi:ankyrin repeat protein